MVSSVIGLPYWVVFSPGSSQEHELKLLPEGSGRGIEVLTASSFPVKCQERAGGSGH